MKNNRDSKTTNTATKAAGTDPGVAYNIADDNKVSSKMVRDQVRIQNNNPRNSD